MRSFAMVIAGGLAAGQLQAQAVQGRVLTGDAGLVPGAVVTALDSAGRPLAAALADDSGRFTMRFATAGRVQLEVRRIGHAPVLDGAFTLQEGEVVARTVVLTQPPLALATEEREPSACLTPGSGGDARVAWEQARTALLATQLTRLTRAYTMDVEVMVRREPADRRQPTSNDRKLIEGTPLQALTSVSPEELAATGYLSQGATGDRYQAPHEDVLLSAAFAATHCLRLLPYDAGARTVRVAFEPLAGRTVPEVRGAVILDRTTLELRRVEFSYTNLAAVGRAGDVTGEITFRRLPDATWITGSWMLTQALAEQYVPPRPLVAGRFGAPPPTRPEIVSGMSRLVTGGTVLRVRSRDSAVWTGTDAAGAASARP